MKPIEYLPLRMRAGMLVYGLMEKIAECSAKIVSLDLMLTKGNNYKINKTLVNKV